MPGLNHIHTYVLLRDRKRQPLKYGDDFRYKCADPKCSHTAPYSLVLDKASLCGKCKKTEIILTKDVLRGEFADKPKVTPTCLACGKSRQAKAYQHAKALAEQFLGSTSQLG